MVGFGVSQVEGAVLIGRDVFGVGTHDPVLFDVFFYLLVGALVVVEFEKFGELEHDAVIVELLGSLY